MPRHRALACRLAWFALALIAVATAAPAQTMIRIDPRHTYLRRNSDPAPEPSPLLLSALNIRGGDVVRLRRFGDYDNGPGGDTFGTMIAVFSNGPTLLSASTLARVPGALEAGCDVTSAPTNFGALPTDIPQDFAVAVGAGATAIQNEVVVVVPAGASHLFVAVHDSLYYDNTDPDGDLAVQITVLPPTSWSTLGGAVGGSGGAPTATGAGELVCSQLVTFDIGRAPANMPVVTVIGATRVDLPVFGGTLIPAPDIVIVLGATDSGGSARLSIGIPVHLPPQARLYFQHVLPDSSAPFGIAMTPGIGGVAP